jgi:hypothetical protein
LECNWNTQSSHHARTLDDIKSTHDSRRIHYNHQPMVNSTHATQRSVTIVDYHGRMVRKHSRERLQHVSTFQEQGSNHSRSPLDVKSTHGPRLLATKNIYN